MSCLGLSRHNLARFLIYALNSTTGLPLVLNEKFRDIKEKLAFNYTTEMDKTYLSSEK